MSSRLPANVRFSLEAFSRRGGLEGTHKDGWGIAWYEEGDVRLVKEAHPAADSACVRFIQEHPFSTTIALSHIRRATQGGVAMKNCQPFVRELGGRMHVFAHNGDLDSAALRAATPLGTFRPVGDTDSEFAFCALLERLRPLWGTGGPPALDERLRIIERFAAAIRRLGPANFIYADGDALFIHAHKRFHPGGTRPVPPGLHVLCRRCAGERGSLDAEGLSVETPGGEQTVVLAASVPLTAELGWRPLAEGELITVRCGAIVARDTAGPARRAYG
jgi:glutamine amidotransferase